jgi:hypothetical protein
MVHRLSPFLKWCGQLYLNKKKRNPENRTKTGQNMDENRTNIDIRMYKLK